MVSAGLRAGRVVNGPEVHGRVTVITSQVKQSLGEEPLYPVRCPLLILFCLMGSIIFLIEKKSGKKQN